MVKKKADVVLLEVLLVVLLQRFGCAGRGFEFRESSGEKMSKGHDFGPEKA